MYVHDLDLFVTVQLLEETPAVPSLGKLCQIHGYSHEWVSSQKPQLTKKRKDKCVQNGKTSYLLLSLDCLQILALPQDSSSTSSSPASGRSDEPAPGNLVRFNKHSKNMKKKHVDRASDDRLRDLAEWSEEFTEIMKIQKWLHPHTFIMTQIRNVFRKWYQNQGSTVLRFISQKTEIAKSACEPK